MDLKATIALISEGLSLAGPLIERFALQDSQLGQSIFKGAEDLLGVGRAAIGGAEVSQAEVEKLVTSFRELKEKGELSQEDFDALATSVHSATASLRETMAAERAKREGG